ncbi:mycofactocin system glycosyltransferase [compost metagenome]
MIHVMNAAGLAVTEQDIARYDAMEVEFQTVVHGRAAGRRLDSDQRSIGAIAGKTELSAVLYFADDDLRFSEAQSIYQPLRQGRQVIRFRLDGTRGPIRQLRCDPMDRPGFLILYSLEVADAQGHTLWRLPADSGQQAMVGLRRALRSPDGEVLFALDDDPQILIPFSLPQHLLSGLSVLLDVEVLCKEQIAHHAMAMDATVAVQAEELGLLTRTLTDREQQLSHMGNDLSRAQQQLAAANHVVEELIRALDEIRSSSSWRLTKPVRHAGRLARIGRNVGRAGLTLLEREGVANLSKKVARVWQREGLAGVISRIRQQHREAMLKPKTEFAPSAPADFQVKLAKAALVRSSHGKYSLVTSSDRYVYIPPQCPEDLDARLELLSSTPRFSIVVPIYNTPPALLSALLDSVQSQWYPHWELILANDASPAQETLAALARVNDPRIKVMHLETNQGIAGATNAALAAATGDFIVFLDHDDELTVDCLYELALCIDRDAPDFVYSDEDKLTEAGEYTQPHFKPDWSPDTMMSTMFTCHVSCVRRSLVEKLAGLRPDYDGCQDWDFVLRLSEHTSRISHIPKVLYHWRIIPASTAADIAAKPYVLDASRRVREDALARRGLAGSVEPVVQVPGYFRVHYHMRGEPLISIIIPTRDNEAVLRRCIESILQNTSYRRFELVVLDNGSVQPGTLAYLNDLRGQDGITVVRHDAPFNFSELNNIGVKASTGELLLFLNDDTEVLSADWLERMGGYAQLSHVGAVGAKLLYPGRNQIQHAGILNLRNGPVHAFLQQEADSPGYFMRNLLEYNWVAVTGACLMIERQKFLQIGGFCEDLPVAYNDVDLCLRLLDVGLYNVVCQAVRLVHHESVSRGMDHLDPVKRERLERELAYLYEKNPAYFQHDPFHNPNLHPNGLNFEVPA